MRHSSSPQLRQGYNKIVGLLAISALAFSPGGFAIAETLDPATPTTDTNSTSSPQTTPVEETVAPPADTAVRAFQEKHTGIVLGPWAIQKGTGYVYKTTTKQINDLYCAAQ